MVNPVWLQYVSHKIGRLFVPWALAGAFFASAVLMFDGWIYAVAFGIMLLFAGFRVRSEQSGGTDRPSRLAPTNTPRSR